MDPVEGGSQEVQPDPGAAMAVDGLWLPVGGALVALLLLAAVVAVVLRRRSAGPVAPETPDPAPAADAPQARVEVERPPAPPAPGGLAARLRTALGRTREALQGQLDALFGRDTVDEALLEELEETLLLADVGLATTHQLLGVAREAAASPDVEPAVVREALRQEMSRILTIGRPGIDTSSASPFVILMVGVNGSGKTTTIGKLSRRFSNEGRKVLVAAADTYRAAAADQLAVWAERADADIVRHDEGADPGAVAYDAMAKALAKGHDVVLVDTAGRLQTRKPLMDQLSKIRRVIDKQVPGAPHETLLVVDGTSGQNALSQARAFHEATPLTGVVVTKLDGTAKGGIVLAISAELGIPVRLIGIGEGVEDLRDFEPAAFVEALA